MISLHSMCVFTQMHLSQYALILQRAEYNGIVFYSSGVVDRAFSICYLLLGWSVSSEEEELLLRFYAIQKPRAANIYYQIHDKFADYLSQVA